VCEEFAKYGLLTSSKYDTLVSAVENWDGFVANSVDCIQGVRKTLADA
jgi:hypothetical protein